jgi:Domain of unknown function (DUF4159)
MRHPRRLVLFGLLALMLAAAASAQIWTGGGRLWGGFRGEPPRFATPALRDGTFHFCRLMYASDRREDGGQGWRTDYPGADINFSIRFSELTKAAVGKDRESEPEYFVVRSSEDDALFQCPFVTMEDAGTAWLSDQDVEQLRKYLLKGGFIWNDDFWGPEAWDQWVGQIARVLPPADYPIVDIPPTHPIFHTQFNSKVIQVPSIQRWRFMKPETSERGELSRDVHTRGIFDKQGRLMVLMTHNTDISDTWEREGEDKEYFYRFSPDGYALAIDVMLYVMSR